MGKSNTTDTKDTRAKNWTVVLYPESAPTNWRELIDDMHIEWVESPLHDKDIDASGEPKKSHWHILLMFGSLKSYEQVRELTDTLNCPMPKKCHNSKALVRYMAHIDNPEKAQYDPTLILSHGGVDLAELLRPSSSERYSMIRDMIIFVKDNHVLEFQDLLDYSAEYRFDDWFPLLTDSCSFIMMNYIKSFRHRNRDERS
jgi:hypothetical protein